jgi:hypothetical protein
MELENSEEVAGTVVESQKYLDGMWSDIYGLTMSCKVGITAYPTLIELSKTYNTVGKKILNRIHSNISFNPFQYK